MKFLESLLAETRTRLGPECFGGSDFDPPNFPRGPRDLEERRGHGTRAPLEVSVPKAIALRDQGTALEVLLDPSEQVKFLAAARARLAVDELEGFEALDRYASADERDPKKLPPAELPNPGETRERRG